VIVGLFFAGLTAFVMWAQPKNSGFAGGHHGWVSSHVLAIIKHADLSNGFVGHTLTVQPESGQVDYVYFDRYPVFFSAGMNLLIDHPWLSVRKQVRIARQVMNLIFCLTMLVAYLLLEKLTGSLALSLSAVLMAFSTPILLHYKDMVHFDQPALLGCMLLLYAIALNRLDGKPLRLVVGVSLLAVSMGRGYASYAILSLWLLFDGLQLVRTCRWRIGQIFREAIRLDSLKVFVIAVTFGALCLSYNIFAESFKRGVNYQRADIIGSAKRRLVSDRGLTTRQKGFLKWSKYSRIQSERFVLTIIPVLFVKDVTLDKSWLLAISAALVGSLITAQRRLKRRLWKLLVFSGIVWILLMRRLTAFHDYTSMFYLGTSLGIYAACIYKLPRLVRWVALPAACVVFVCSVRVYGFDGPGSHNSLVRNQFTSDFNRITPHLKNGDRVYIEGTDTHLHYPEIVPGAPFAVGFYLADQVLTTKARSRCIISKNQKLRELSLTPYNLHFFLVCGSKGEW